MLGIIFAKMHGVSIRVDKARLLRQGERLRSIRERRAEETGRRITQGDAANVLGIIPNTYRSYEYGRAELPENYAVRLAAEWDVSWKAFYEAVGEPSPPWTSKSDVGGPRAPIPIPSVQIPYVGNIGANSLVDWLDPVDTNEFIDVPNEMATPKGPSARFACTIVGDSCFDLLWPGDTAVFHKSNVPRIGQIMVFRSNDGHVTVKQIKHNGREFVLHPLNPNYDDVVAEGSVLGYLIGIVRQQGSKKVTVFDEHGITP